MARAVDGVSARLASRAAAPSLSAVRKRSPASRHFFYNKRVDYRAAVHVQVAEDRHAVLELALGQGLRRLGRRELGLVRARRHEGRGRAEA